MVASFRRAQAAAGNARTGEAERELQTAEFHCRQAAESKGSAGAQLAESTRRNAKVVEEFERTQQLYARASAERRMLRARLETAHETREERQKELADMNAVLASQQAELVALNARSALLQDQRMALAAVHSPSASSPTNGSSIGAMALEDRLRADNANNAVRQHVSELVTEILAADREAADFEQTRRTLELSLQDLRRPESVASELSVQSVPCESSRSCASPENVGQGAVEAARAVADQLDRDRLTAQLRLDLARQRLAVLEGRAKILNGELDGQRGCMEALHSGTWQELLEAKDLFSASSRTRHRVALEREHEQRRLVGAAIGSFSARCSPSPMPPSLAASAPSPELRESWKIATSAAQIRPSLAGSAPSPELRESWKAATSAAPIRPLAPLTARGLRSDLAVRKGAWSPNSLIVGND